MDKLFNILEIYHKNGMWDAYNCISENKKNLDEQAHLIKVLQFCELLSILIDLETKREKLLYISLQVQNIEYSVNAHTIKLSYGLFDYNKNLYTDKNLDLGIKAAIENLGVFSAEFISPNLLQNPSLIPLRESIKEQLKEILLNKKLYTAYQTDFLKRTLFSNTSDEQKYPTKI